MPSIGVPNMTERIGEKLGKYRLLRNLGHGGFAEVYVGEHVFLGSQAAIKILSTSLKSEEIDSFQIEPKRLANLNHPNIIRILDFDL
jgi:serine/threonine protein kinase